MDNFTGDVFYENYFICGTLISEVSKGKKIKSGGNRSVNVWQEPKSSSRSSYKPDPRLAKIRENAIAGIMKRNGLS